MPLCQSCRALDVRKLLQLHVDHGAYTAADTDATLPYLPFHDSILAVRNGGNNGCELCAHLWAGFLNGVAALRSDYFYTGPTGPITDEQVEAEYGAVVCNITELPGSPIKARINVLAPKVYGDNLYKDVASFVPSQAPDSQLDGDSALLSLLTNQIEEYSGSKTTLNWTLARLNECRTSHEDCDWAHKRPRNLPTRVVDVGSETEHPRLHVSQGRLESWAALSYCWGGNCEFVLTQASRQRLEGGVPLQEFPATLRDAILVTRGLGIQYLWIDALCILQDSADDWAAEAPKMGEVYSNAEVVIAATASLSVHSGIFKRRELGPIFRLPWSSSTAQETTADGATQRPQYIHLRAESTAIPDELAIGNSHWGTRGWTMQEDFLSTRLLAFTTQPVAWECLSITALESGETSSSSAVFPESRDYMSRYVRSLIASLQTAGGSPKPALPVGPGSNPEQDVYDMWYALVSKYTGRNLTKTRDRLPALAGIAAYFARAADNSYCGGLWAKDLLYGLAWGHGYMGHANTDGDAGGKSLAESETGGPSWSWASLEGELDKWPYRPIDAEWATPQPPTRVLDVRVEQVGPSEFGLSTGARLTIEAPCVIWEAGKPETVSENGESVMEFVLERIAHPQWAVSTEFRLRHKAHPGQMYAAIFLLVAGGDTIVLLVLESVQKITPNGKGDVIPGSTGISDDGDGQKAYRRVGKLELRLSSDWLNPADSVELPRRTAAFATCTSGNLPIEKFVLV